MSRNVRPQKKLC